MLDLIRKLQPSVVPFVRRYLTYFLSMLADHVCVVVRARLHNHALTVLDSRLSH